MADVTDPNGAVCDDRFLDNDGVCLPQCYSQGSPEPYSSQHFNPILTLDGTHCADGSDCPAAPNGRCINNCTYKDCGQGCNDEGPNDGGRDCRGNCYGPYQIDCNGLCTNSTETFGYNYGETFGYSGTVYFPAELDGTRIIRWDFNDLYCQGQLGYGTALDALNVPYGTCNDSAACSENQNGCLYYSCNTDYQSCNSTDPLGNSAVDCAGNRYCPQTEGYTDPNGNNCWSFGWGTYIDHFGFCCGTCNDSSACGEDSGGCLYDWVGAGCGIDVCGNYGNGYGGVNPDRCQVGCDSYDALGYCGGTCNDSSACGEDGNGCLYTNWMQYGGPCELSSPAVCTDTQSVNYTNNDPYSSCTYEYDCAGNIISGDVSNAAPCYDSAKDAIGYCCGNCFDSSACGEDGSGCRYTNCDGTCTSATQNPTCQTTDPNGNTCDPSALDYFGYCYGDAQQDCGGQWGSPSGEIGPGWGWECGWDTCCTGYTYNQNRLGIGYCCNPGCDDQSSCGQDSSGNCQYLDCAGVCGGDATQTTQYGFTGCYGSQTGIQVIGQDVCGADVTNIDVVSYGSLGSDVNGAICQYYSIDGLGYCCGTCNDSSACGEDGSGCLYTNCDGTCTSATQNPSCCPQASDVRAGVNYVCDNTSHTGTLDLASVPTWDNYAYYAQGDVVLANGQLWYLSSTGGWTVGGAPGAGYGWKQLSVGSGGASINIGALIGIPPFIQL